MSISAMEQQTFHKLLVALEAAAHGERIYYIARDQPTRHRTFIRALDTLNASSIQWFARRAEFHVEFWGGSVRFDTADNYRGKRIRELNGIVVLDLDPSDISKFLISLSPNHNLEFVDGR